MPETWKPPIATMIPRSPQRGRKVERSRELVRLDADQHHHSGAGLLHERRDACRADVRVRLVEGVDNDWDVVAEHVLLGALQRKPIQHRQRIRWDSGSKPLDDIAVIVVV